VKNSPVEQYQTANHYVSTGALLHYVEKILKPYREKMMADRVAKGQNPQPRTPLIFLIDCCTVHTSEETWTKLLSKCHDGDEDFWWLRIVFVPANTTGRKQPCDVGFFGRLKRLLILTRTKLLIAYFQGRIREGKFIGDTKSIGEVASKTVLLQAILTAYDVLLGQVEANVAAWTKCGITVEALMNEDNFIEATRRKWELFPKMPRLETEADDEDDDAEFINDNDDSPALLSFTVKRGREETE